MSALHLVSTAALALLLVGFAFRSERRAHRAFMLAAFTVDLGLVVWIETTRGAVEQIGGGMPALLGFHVAISTAVLVCYVGMIALGTRLFSGRFELKAWHRNLGMTFVVLRGLNYVTSFLV